MRVLIKLLLLGHVFAVNIFLLTFFYIFLLAGVKLFFPSFTEYMMSTHPALPKRVARLEKLV